LASAEGSPARGRRGKRASAGDVAVADILMILLHECAEELHIEVS